MSNPNIDINVSGPKQASSTYKTIVLKGNQDFASQIYGKTNHKFIIKYDFDLGLRSVVIPQGCLLDFDGGSISNGALVGQNTILIYYQGLDDIFHNVTRSGSFIYNNTLSADEEDLTEEGNLVKLKDRDTTDGMGRIILRKNKTFAEQLTQENTIYEIRYDFDLGGEEVTIPENCVLKFEGGSLSNGTLVGQNTGIQASLVKIFNTDVIIGGSWKVNNVYSAWFNIIDNEDNTRAIKNLFALCNDNILNNVYIDEHYIKLIGDFVYIEALHSDAFCIFIPSNTHVHNAATFKVIPHSHDELFLFNFYNVENCSWDGGTLIGDLEDHLTDTGEGEFGFSLRAAKNIKISNVICKDFWGDGINLQVNADISPRNTENVIIENVVCDRNRRQGISIESGINVLVNNCVFSNTGTVRGTLPKAGIDIEPISTYEYASIKNIRIEDSKTVGNSTGIDLRMTEGQELSDVTINNCIIQDKFSWNGYNDFGTSCLKVLNSNLRSVVFAEYINGVYFENCTLNALYGYKSGSDAQNQLLNAKFKRCNFKSKGSYTSQFIGLVNVNFVADYVNADFDECSFIVDSDSDVVTPIQVNPNANFTIKNSIIENNKSTYSDLYVNFQCINNTIYLPVDSKIQMKSVGKLINNQITYKTFSTTGGLVRFMESGTYDIIGNKFIYNGSTSKNYIFSRTGSQEVTINLYYNDFPIVINTPFVIDWATINYLDNIVGNARHSGAAGFERPGANSVYLGFMFFDRSASFNMPIFVSAINGNTITWVNSEGIRLDNVTAVIGTTATRLSMSLTSTNVGLKYYDKDLSKYVLWNGSSWTNLDGSALN